MEFIKPEPIDLTLPGNGPQGQRAWPNLGLIRRSLSNGDGRLNKLYSATNIITDTWLGSQKAGADQTALLGYSLLVYVDCPNAPKASKYFDEFVLPINPQNISYRADYAISVTPTTRGIYEEHNGHVFTEIVVSGTTGFAPGYVRHDPISLSKLNDQFGGGADSDGETSFFRRVGEVATPNTLAAIDALGPAITGATSPIDAGEEKTKRALVQGLDLFSLHKMGHAQIHQLRNWLTAYAEYKKNRLNRDSRLAFVSRKDRTVYFCTPVSFTFSKNAENPHLWNYKLILKAWAVQELNLFEIYLGNLQKDVSSFTPIDKSDSFIKLLLNIVDNFRNIFGAFSDVITGVVRDVDRLMEIANTVASIANGIAGLAESVANLPATIGSRIRQVVAKFRAIGNRFSNLADKFGRSGKFFSNLGSVPFQTGGAGPGVAPNRIGAVQARALQNSLSKNALNADAQLNSYPGTPISVLGEVLPDGTLSDSPATNYQQASDDLFSTENRYTDIRNVASDLVLLKEIRIEELNLSEEELRQVTLEVEKIRSKTLEEYDLFRKSIIDFRDSFAESRGLSDETYNAVSKRTASLKKTKKATLDDYKILNTFNDIIFAIDGFTASLDFLKKDIPDPFAVANNILEKNNSDILLHAVSNGFPVNFTYNSTLLALSRQYLGTPDRWMEIALLNGLEPPYVDEEGFTQNFLSSGNGNSFSIASSDNLFIGQEVFLSSSRVRQEKRHITNINRVSDTNYIVTVDGDDDLDKYKTSQFAAMKAYLPNTINSNKLIFIPTERQTIEPNSLMPETRATILGSFTEMQKIMGLDIALNSNFDLDLGPNNDVIVSTGLNNAKQALLIKLMTGRGQLIRHPSFGVGFSVGTPLLDNLRSIKDNISYMVLADTRFSRISSLKLQSEGSTVRVSAIVEMSAGSGIIPLNTAISRK